MLVLGTNDQNFYIYNNTGRFPYTYTCVDYYMQQEFQNYRGIHGNLYVTDLCVLVNYEKSQCMRLNEP